MIAAKRMAAEQGIGLRLVGHSPTVVDILDLTDLVNHFGDPLIIQKGAQA
jgi:anti-anti-sigma regulatory factor